MRSPFPGAREPQTLQVRKGLAPAPGAPYCRDVGLGLLFDVVRKHQNTGCTAVVVLIIVLTAAPVRGQQKVNKVEQGQAQMALHQVQDVIEKRYYDPAFHGFDLHARFAEAEKKINELPTLNAGLGAVAWAVEGLNDSHTTFVPPLRNVIIDKGWQMEMVGDKCVIWAVQPGSDAWKQGLRPGDEVLKVESYEPNRATFARIEYRLEVVAPLAEYHFVVASPGQKARQVVTKSRQEVFPQELRGFTGGDTLHQVLRLIKGYGILGKSRTAQVNDKLMIWKLPEFNLSPADTNRYMDSAKKHETLILDLRNNRGGSEDALRWLVGNFFDRDITVGDVIGRKGKEPLRFTSRKSNAFAGKLIVLVNSQSASAAEIFSRVVQIEKRGIVMGDQTSGEVGRAEGVPLEQGGMTIIHYAVEVTVSRLQMLDGKDLEGTGVAPDTKILPTQADMAAGRDPVLAAALQLAGSTLSPEEAGKMFPVQWLTH